MSAKELSAEELAKILEKSRSSQPRSFDFQETKTLRLLKDPVVTEGTLIVSPPNRFRREVKTPQPSLAVSNGQVLWLYYPAFAEAEKYDLGKQNPISKMIEAISASFAPEKLRDLFEITGTSNPEGYELTLKPKSSTLRRNVAELRLRLSSDLKLKESILTARDGSKTLTSYRNEKVIPVAENVFDFEPPAGTQTSEPLK